MHNVQFLSASNLHRRHTKKAAAAAAAAAVSDMYPSSCLNTVLGGVGHHLVQQPHRGCPVLLQHPEKYVALVLTVCGIVWAPGYSLLRSTFPLFEYVLPSPTEASVQFSLLEGVCHSLMFNTLQPRVLGTNMNCPRTVGVVHPLRRRCRYACPQFVHR